MNLPEGLAFNNQETPFITRIGNILKDGTVMQNQKASLYWHSDGDITEAPGHFIYIMLNAKIVPPVGGRTGFLDMRSLSKELSPEILEWFQDAKIEIKIANIDDFMGCKEAEIMPNVRHNVNQIHPVREIPQLYLCAHQGFVTFKDGKTMSTPDVMEKIYDEKFTYIHQYEEGDLVIWDDIQMHHRSWGGFGNHQRLLFRGQSQAGDVEKLIKYVRENLGKSPIEYESKNKSLEKKEVHEAKAEGADCDITSEVKSGPLEIN